MKLYKNYSTYSFTLIVLFKAATTWAQGLSHAISFDSTVTLNTNNIGLRVYEEFTTDTLMKRVYFYRA